jgi:hypothetical protein
MNVKRKFNCKVEDLNAVGGYLVQRACADWALFTEFSDTFSDAFMDNLRALIAQSAGLVASEKLTKEVTTITDRIEAVIKQVKLDANKMEQYFKMADGQMTVRADSMGLQQLRDCIRSGGSEGVVQSTRQLLIGVNQNIDVLQSKGLKQDLLNKLQQEADELETLGNDQNFKMTERNSHTDDNNVVYNELWDQIVLITDTGKALYRGVDATKVDDYTIASILNRIGTPKRRKTNTPEAPKA